MTQLASMIVGAGCFWKTEAAYRFLFGVNRTEVGHIALPLDGDPPLLTPVNQSPRLWRVEVVAVEVDLDILPLDRFMEVFWITHTACEMWNPTDPDFMSCRSLLVVPASDLRSRVKTLMDIRLAQLPIRTRLYEAAAYQRAPEGDQDFFVHHPEDSYSTSQVIPCLKKIWETMPDQMDIAEDSL